MERDSCRMLHETRDHRTVHVIGHSLRAHEYEIRSQLDLHPDASVREKNSLGRLPVPERCVSSAVQEHEEGICWGHHQSKKRVPLSE